MKYILLICSFSFLFIFIFSVNSYSGSFPRIKPNTASSQLYYYYDLRDRETQLQVYNTDSSSIIVHVQIFQANGSIPCSEIDFFDVFTPNDMHVYNMRTIIRNDGSIPPIALADDTYGFVVITVFNSISGSSVSSPVLIGSFRIFDDNGFEYRSNSAPYPTSGGTSDRYNFNYSQLGVTTFADVVLFSVGNAGPGFSAVSSGSTSTETIFSPAITDENENTNSCASFAVTCGNDYGINLDIPGSKTTDSVCPFVNMEQGFVSLNIASASSDFFFGFIGLNDGMGKGSMDLITPAN